MYTYFFSSNSFSTVGNSLSSFYGDILWTRKLKTLLYLTTAKLIPIHNIKYCKKNKKLSVSQALGKKTQTLKGSSETAYSNNNRIKRLE